MRIVLCLLVICFFSLSTVSANPDIQINIPEYLLVVSDKGQVIKKYDIAVGTPYEQTPVGTYAIFDKIESPTWYPGSNFTDRTPVSPGPDNPLGSRWMEFAPSYGIHGTNNDWSMGYAVSGGCIRMHDKEARELYERVGIGTPVVVIYETLRVIEKADGLYLTVLPDIYGKKTSSQSVLQKLIAPFAGLGFEFLTPPVFPLRETDEVYEIKLAVRRPPSPKATLKTPQPH